MEHLERSEYYLPKVCLSNSTEGHLQKYQNKAANFYVRDLRILKKLQSILVFLQNVKFQNRRQEM